LADHGRYNGWDLIFDLVVINEIFLVHAILEVSSISLIIDAALGHLLELLDASRAFFVILSLLGQMSLDTFDIFFFLGLKLVDFFLRH
jgi:hypothetical protein